MCLNVFQPILPLINYGIFVTLKLESAIHLILLLKEKPVFKEGVDRQMAHS